MLVPSLCAVLDRLSAVIARYKEEAQEQTEVLASYRRASGPATPLKTSRFERSGGNTPTFVISPGDDSAWHNTDMPADFALESLTGDSAGDAASADTAELGVAEPPLLHFPSLAAFNAAAAAFGSPTAAQTKKKGGSARPPLAPSSSLLNVGGMLSSISKFRLPSKKREASDENTDSEPSKTSKIMRTLSDVTLHPVDAWRHRFSSGRKA